VAPHEGPNRHDHDRGLVHDLRAMLTRRRALYLAGIAGASVLSACASGGTKQSPTSASATTPDTAVSAASCAAAAPQETAGPYPGDGSNGPNVLIESGIVRNDIRTSFGAYSGTAEGVPATITLTLQDLTKECAAGAGMAIYVWHCDRDGQYSLYSQNAADQNYLRGVQVADATGTVSFTSVFPACYDGRWPHIHFEVFDSLQAAVAGDNARLTSQLALPQEACETVFAHDPGYARSVRNFSRVSLDTDNVFGAGWDAELARVTGEPSIGMAIALTIGVAAQKANTQVPGAPQAGRQRKNE
jgi:protocatechuate 3,4-dioxygenase beta subunit